MFIEQNKLKRQSHLLLQSSAPDQQLLKALDENAKLTQLLEEEKIQHQKKVTDFLLECSHARTHAHLKWEELIWSLRVPYFALLSYQVCLFYLLEKPQQPNELNLEAIKNGWCIVVDFKLSQRTEEERKGETTWGELGSRIQPTLCLIPIGG